MLNEREVKYRMKCAKDAGVPFTNYGTTIGEDEGNSAKEHRHFPKSGWRF